MIRNLERGMQLENFPVLSSQAVILEQLKHIGRELAMGSQAWGNSKEFLDIVKSIGEARSKVEEERIVAAEIEILKKRIAEPDVPRRKMKEFIMRLVYVEMLGHDASFGYIHAVKMTHDDNLLLKKTGYLAVTLFLNEDHDLIILIVNTIQNDLKSDNHLVACAALTAVCKLINEETIPAVLPQVVDLLKHPKEIVRKKAILALHRFHLRAPQTVSHLLPRIQQAIDEKDPSVISATLCVLFDLISADPQAHKQMTLKFVQILKNVSDNLFPKIYEYHKTPAPFIQIKLLKILALLGAGDKATSELMYNVLSVVLNKNRSGASSNIVYAILYECMCTITSIHPHQTLIEDVADITSKFMKQENHNLKYMGIDSLGRIIKTNPQFAEQHQLAVIDCLEDPDDTLKRKTLDLLYKMTRSTNVEVIVGCMITYMRTVNDSHSKKEIASRIIELAERYAPSNKWFIATMNEVFQLAGDLVTVNVAHDLMRLIAEGAGEDDEDAGSQLRASAVQSYLQVLEEPKLPSVLLQVICWVLGEYGTADSSHSASDIIGRLCDVIEAHPGDDAVKGYAITGITKICAFEVSSGRKVDLSGFQAVIDELLASHSTDLQQRAYELEALLSLPADVVSNVLPLDASCEEVEVDENLPFLMGIVETALANGARPYVAEIDRDDSGLGSLVNDLTRNGAHPVTLKYEAYEVPTPALAAPQSTPSLLEFRESQPDHLPPKPSASHSISVSPDIDLIHPESTRLRLDGVQRKWGQPTISPSVSSTSIPDKDQSSNGTARADRGPTYSTDGFGVGGSSESGRKQATPVSEAKQKLAASLFGGADTSTGSASGEKLPRGSQKGRGHRTGEKYQQPRQSQAAPPAPPAPQPDLLDFSDEGPAAAAPPPASDPFQMLEGLIDATSSSTGQQHPLSKPAIDLASLYDTSITATPSATPFSVDMSGGSLIGLAAVPQSSSAPTVLPRKGSGFDGSLQKDVTARQAGVIPTTVNPDMFKDLLG